MTVIKVASHSRTSAVAGAIAGVFRETGSAEIQAIGAGAVNQAIKAVAIAKGYLAEEGTTISFSPSFVEVEIDGEVRTAVRLSVEGTKPADIDTLLNVSQAELTKEGITPADPSITEALMI